MAALFRTAVLMAMIAMVHASTDDIKHTTVGGPSLALIETSVTTNTVGGPSLALIETSVTTSEASVAHNMIPSIGQRDATLNETIDFDQQNKVLYKSVDMQVLGTQKSNPHIRLLISELNKSAAQRRNVRKHIRTIQRKRFAGWLFFSRSKMFRSDLG